MRSGKAAEAKADLEARIVQAIERNGGIFVLAHRHVPRAHRYAGTTIAKGRDTSALCPIYRDSTNLRGSDVAGPIRQTGPAYAIQRRRRVHTRCRIDRIFINHHRRWRYTQRPATHDGLGNDGNRLLDNDRRHRPELVRVNLPLIAWNAL
jgi:hypothetical protein